MFLVMLARKYKTLGYGVKFQKAREINDLVTENFERIKAK
jgi:hypothetical protein